MQLYGEIKTFRFQNVVQGIGRAFCLRHDAKSFPVR